MKQLFTIFLITFFCQNLFAQSLSRKSLIKNFSLKGNTNVLINGEIFSPSDSLKLEKNLKSLNSKLIAGITRITNKGEIGCQNSDIIIIEYAVELPNKVIFEKYTEVKDLFTDKYLGYSQHTLDDSKDPVLYIDNKRVYHTEVKSELAKLKKNEIAYINIKRSYQSQELHGQNAKNGVVIIWTRLELKKASS